MKDAKKGGDISDFSKPCKLRKIVHNENSSAGTSLTSINITKEIDVVSSFSTTAGNNISEGNNSTSVHKICDYSNFVRENINFTSDFDIEIEQLLNQMVLSEEKVQNTMSKLLHDLRNNVKSINCPHELLPFGSYVNGLTCKESDVDICFKPLSEDIFAIKPLMNSLAKSLRKSKLFSQIICIRNARVPVIKLVHKATKKNCDISFSNEIGVRNTLLMKFYLTLNSSLKLLVLFLKHLLQKHDLQGCGKITTYMLFWLTVYYMQQKDLLPPVMNACHLTEQKDFISGWNCSVPEHFKIPIKDRYSLFFHVKEFLKFYTDFQFMKFVICPYIACAIRIDYFENLTIPNDTFSSYLEKLKMRNDTKFSPGLINVQDPFIHNFNLTKSVELPSLNKFKVLCDRGYKILSEELNNKKANDILNRILTVSLPHKNNPPNRCIQYMSVYWDISKLPQHIVDIYEQEGITYLCNNLKIILETELGCKLKIIYGNEVERMVRKDNKLQNTIAPMCFLTSSMEEESVGEQEKQCETETKLSKIFVILETLNDGKHMRISVESEGEVICFLKQNLFNLFAKF